MAVGLTYFRGIPMDNAVRLEWHTETELNTAAFKIQRSGAGSSFVWLEEIGFSGYVMAEGGPSQPTSYQVIDRTARNGERYTYKLIEIESDSSETEVAETSVTAGIPTPTATATQVIASVETVPASPTQPPAAAGGNTSTPTATTVSSGPAATATPRPASTATRRPTTVPSAPTMAATAAQTAAQPPLPSNTPMALAAASSAQPIQLNAVQSEASLATPEPVNTAADGQIGAAYPSLQDSGSEGLGTGYPGDPPPVPELRNDPTAYPAGGENESNISVIGSGSQTSDTPAGESTPTEVAMQGTYLLWGGCILATLIFAASIFGSIYLYTRKRE